MVAAQIIVGALGVALWLIKTLSAIVWGWPKLLYQVLRNSSRSFATLVTIRRAS
jgi:hypothetical protein